MFLTMILLPAASPMGLRLRVAFSCGFPAHLRARPGYISLHKNVKSHFSSQYGTMFRAKDLAAQDLTLSQWRSPSVIDRAARVSIGLEPNGRSTRPPRGPGTPPKRPEKLQKTAFFDPSNRSTSARQGCRRFAWSA